MKSRASWPSPHLNTSFPVHNALSKSRGAGALTVVVAVQLSDIGLYFPPVFSTRKFSSRPPQTIISLPVQTVACLTRASGASVVLVAVQLSVARLYFSPVFTWRQFSSFQPQLII